MSVILQCVFLLMIVLGSSAWAGTPTVTRGSFDVSHLKGPEAVNLEGDWLVLSGRLLIAEEVLQLDWSASQFEHVGFQNLFAIKKDQPLKKTYVLKLKGLEKEQSWALQSGMIVNATRISVVAPNQGSFLIWEQGQFSDQGGTMPSIVFCCRVGQLPSLQGEAFVVVHVEVKQVDSHLNFNAILLQPPRLGEADRLLAEDRWHSYEVFFVIGLYFLLSLNSLSLFLQRREDKASLYLAGFGLGLILRYAGTEGVFYRIMGNGQPYDFIFNLFALYAALGLILACLIQFLHHTFSGVVPRWGRTVIVSFAGFCALMPFVLTGPELLLSWMPVVALQVGAGFFCVYVSIRAAQHKEEGAIFGLIGLGLVAVTHLNDFMVATHMYQFPYLGHLGLAGMMFSQALITGKRFASTYERTRNLSAELAHKNEVLIEQKAEISKLNDELLDYNSRLEHKVEEKTRDIKSILRSIRQGILLIDRADGTIGDEHSNFLSKMLNTEEIAGKNIMDLCFLPSNLSADGLDQLRNSLSIIIHEDELAFDMNALCLPQEIVRNINGEQQILELEWSPVIDGHCVNKLLLVIRDVTELRRLQHVAEHQKREMELIAQVINIPADKFNGIIRSIERLLESNFQILFRHETLSLSDIDHLYRNMHTVKGIARSYQLRGLTEMIHLAEERYKDCKSGQLHAKEDLLHDLKRLRECLHEIKQVNYDRLGRHAHEDRYIQVDKKQMEENLRNLNEIDIQNLKDHDKDRFEALMRLFKMIVYTPLHKVIEGQIHSLTDLSRALNKVEPTIDIIDPGISLNRDSHEFLSHVFGHLIRNSMDHGLEAPEERRRKGKDPKGCIRMEMRLSQETLNIFMTDDGRGINLLKVWQRALERGLVRDDEQVSAIDVANFILMPGFSTAERVTDISGRGMGLDAVANYLEEQGGSLELVLEDPRAPHLGIVPLKFLITLPSTHFQVVA